MIKEIMKNYSFVYILLAVVFQSTSGIFSKVASASINHFSLLLIISNVFYIMSIVCLVLQSLVWQMALKHYDLSFAYPFMSIVNFVVLISSYYLFNESITIYNILGLLIISAGIYLITKDGIRT
jgi:multidrug transporter EmrE-like cation transporter